MAFDASSIRYFIREHGILMSLKKRDQGEYDSVTGTIGYLETDYSFYGFSYNHTPYFLNQNSIVVASLKIVIPSKQANGLAMVPPKVNDQVIINNLIYDILKVSEVSSANSVVCYTVDVKG